MRTGGAERSSSGGCAGFIAQILWNEGFGVAEKIDGAKDPAA
jgi:hypothetical protein